MHKKSIMTFEVQTTIESYFSRV